MRLSHYRPSRAAARAHERKLFRNFSEKMLSLLNSAEIGSDRYFHHIRKSEFSESGFHPCICKFFSELTGDSWSNYGIYRSSGLYCFDGLIYLALVYDSRERTAVKAHSAGHALILINHRMPVLILTYSAKPARFYARPLLFDNSIVLAGLHAHTALDAFFSIYDIAAQIPVI